MEPADIFNPIKFQGTKWVTLRETSTGMYAELWYEVDRNKIGRVTVCPAYAWKTSAPLITLDKHISELFTEKQAGEKILASNNWHPATAIICSALR